MAKLTADNITEEMVFEVESYVEKTDFGYKSIVLSELMTGYSINPDIGTRVVVVTPPTGSGTKQVQWKIEGETEVWTSFWGVFRNNTRYVSGDVNPTITERITSTEGKFNGFDVEVSRVEIEDLTEGTNYPEATLSIYLDFIGTSEGKKKITTNIINKVKASGGFKQHVQTLVSECLEDKQDDINKLLEVITEDKREVYTWYSGGKVSIDVNIANDIETMEEDIGKVLDKFIQSKTSKSQYTV